MYAEKTDMELVGHVFAIPDASELSQSLAARIKILVAEKEEQAQIIQRLKSQVMALELGIALDKISAYDDLLK